MMFFPSYFSCTPTSSTPKAEPSEEVVEPSEEVLEPSEEVGTDEDGDGFTVENGDCDDTMDQSIDG